MILLIVGSAASVVDDLLAYPHTGDIMAVNYMGLFLPHITSWASLHIGQLQRLMQLRLDENLPIPQCIYTPPFYDPRTPDGHMCLSSGLYATLVALTLPYTQILLAGMPVDDTPTFPFLWSHAPAQRERERQQWEQLAQTDAAQKIRALSGYTRTRFGAPAPLEVPACV